MCKYTTARVHQYGLNFSAFSMRARSTLSEAPYGTCLMYAIGPQPANRASAITQRRIDRTISPRTNAPPVSTELDRHVDRRSEHRNQRHDERPAELDLEQRDARAGVVAGVVSRRRQPAD